VFFVAWAAVAARPWGRSEPDPRLAALALREQRLRADATLVQQVVESRMAAYRVALEARQAQIASARAQSLPVTRPTAAAPAVRVVNLPPLTITRTS
jgi:hypothetical protein